MRKPSVIDVFLTVASLALSANCTAINAVFCKIYGSEHAQSTHQNHKYAQEHCGDVNFQISPLCDWNWKGVICADHEVIELHLSDSGIRGAFPEALLSLSSLEVLDLSSNQITGSLPTGVSALNSLHALNLANNFLTGTLPSSIFLLQHLETLHVEGNSLKEAPCDNINDAGCVMRRQLQTSTNMDTALCDLAAAMNIASKTANLGYEDWSCSGSGLSRIASSACSWYGITCVSGKVTKLLLPGMGIVGSIPSTIGLLTDMQEMSFMANSIVGNLPTSLSALLKLTNLNVGWNKLAGGIPVHIGSLTNMYYLDLSKNAFTGGLPSSLSKLKELSSLDVNSNVLSGTLPSGLGTLPNLHYFYAQNNYFSGSVPASFTGLTQLEELNLFANSFTGKYPQGLCDSFVLSTFYLFSNSVKQCNMPTSAPTPAPTTATPLSLRSMCDIVDSTNVRAVVVALSASGWICTGSGPTRGPMMLCGWFGVGCNAQSEVISIALGNRGITGVLPSTIGHLSFLTHLHLQQNALTATIPSSIGSLTKLQIVELFLNSFSGSLPSNIGQLGKVTHFQAYGNKLVGTIPASVSTMTSLQYLELQSNKLTGTLPPQLPSSVVVVNLFVNSLTGSIPSSYTALTQMQTLDIHTNNMNGAYHSSMCQLGLLSKFRYTVANTNQCVAPTASPTRSPTHKPTASPTADPLHAALCDFIDATNIPTRRNDLGWTGWGCLGQVAVGLCSGISWTGVTCTGASLTGISLPNSGLNGYIPFNIGSLTSVQTLDLSSNQFSGFIPGTIQNIPLTRLALFNNKFSGPLPPVSSSMVILNLGDNSFTGPIPTSYSTLTKLETLQLYGSKIGGTIPNWISSMTKLTKLSLRQNSLTGSMPAGLSTLVKLDAVLFYGNSLTGTLPPAYGSLTNLRTFSISDNSISGYLPTSIGLMTKLITMHVLKNSLSGSIPSEFGNMVNLVEFEASYNSLSGSLPASISKLEVLELLVLNNNVLSGSLPLVLPSLLNELVLSNNKLIGGIPSSYAGLNQLQGIDLSGNKMNGQYPLAMCDLAASFRYMSATVDQCVMPTAAPTPHPTAIPTSAPTSPAATLAMCDFLVTTNVVDRKNANGWSGWLCGGVGNGRFAIGGVCNWYGVTCSGSTVTHIILPDVGLSGSLPNNIGSLTGLGHLDLNTNTLGGTIPASITSAPLTVLYLHRNAFVGTLPQLPTTLQLLNLGSNLLAGTIPNSYGSMTNLQQLSLYSNSIVSPLPESLTRLNKLETLHLYHMQFGGTLPIWLTTMHRLTQLHVFNSNFTGRLPVEYSTMTSLRVFSVGSNRLTGSIPSVYSGMKSMERFLVHINSLTGSIPQSFSTFSNMTVLALHNNKFSGNYDIVSAMPKLVALYVCNNTFSGTVPASLSTLSQLETLYLYNNLYSSRDYPHALCSMTKLKVFYLSSVSVHECTLPTAAPTHAPTLSPTSIPTAVPTSAPTSIPTAAPTASGATLAMCDLLDSTNIAARKATAGWSGWTCSGSGNSRVAVGLCSGVTWHGVVCTGSTVTSISLASAGLTGSLPNTIGQLSGLTHLNLNTNSLGGTIPASVSQSPLTYLHVFKNNFIGILPPTLPTTLINVNFGLNSLIGPIPSSYGSLTNLQLLAIYASSVTGTIPSTFSQLQKLEMLYIGNVNTSSSVPLWITTMHKLTQLTIFNSSVTGTLPDGLSTLTNLRVLSMAANNRLGGSIPSSYSTMRSITNFMLYMNAHTGTIPASFSVLTNMTLFGLSANYMRGNIDVVVHMKKLTHLYISNNSFSGTIPNGISELSNLAYLYLNDIPLLSRNYPHSLCSSTKLKDFFLSSSTINECKMPTAAPTVAPTFAPTLSPTLAPLPSHIALCALISSTNIASLRDAHQWSGWQCSGTGGGLIAVGLCSADWHGVTCDAGRVIRISLQNAGIQGVLPSQLGLLTDTVSIDFTDNSFSGTIPSTIGNIPNLYYLSLMDNDLTGTIPTSVSKMSKMTQIFLNRNNIGGTIPSAISGMVLLQKLQVATNALTGTLPSTLSTMTELELVDVSNNLLSGTLPVSLSLLTKLSVLSAYSTKLSGTLPPEIGTLAKLNSLQVYNTLIGGSIPDSVCKMTSLEALYLSKNRLTGSIPACIGLLTKMKHIMINENLLNASLPMSIVNMTNLATLSIRANSLTGEIPATFGRLTDMVELLMDRNRFTGSLPLSLANMNKLQVLQAHNNQFNGAYPSELCSMAQLNIFTYMLESNQCVAPTVSPTAAPSAAPTSLSNNDIAFCDIIASTNIKDTIVVNQLSGWKCGANGVAIGLCGSIPWTGVDCTGNTVTSLRLGFGNLNGTLPSTLGLLTDLELFFVSFSSITGTLPDLSGASKLQRLVVRRSMIGGTIPSSYGDFPRLTALLLQWSRFSGTIPSSLGKLTNVVNLNIAGNSLTGTIPSTIGSMSNLQFLTLYNNSLTGALPNSLTNLVNLTYMNLAENNLNNAYPSGLCSMTKLVTFRLSNNTLQQCVAPTVSPTVAPTAAPTHKPTFAPTGIPTSIPSSSPTSIPTSVPTSQPSSSPTSIPTSLPTSLPSCAPTGQPTAVPTGEPTSLPSCEPTSIPSGSPTSVPTCQPSSLPSSVPTSTPTSLPSGQPTSIPTSKPTSIPTGTPSSLPTVTPSALPTGQPTSVPTGTPTSVPSSQPTFIPTGQPTSIPSGSPSVIPTSEPTAIPTGLPTAVPSSRPSSVPTALPSGVPSNVPSSVPTSVPSAVPSSLPTSSPTNIPTSIPSNTPTSIPSSVPTAEPTSAPSLIPTASPTSVPTLIPTSLPSNSPSHHPTVAPTALPSRAPSSAPSMSPTVSPTRSPITPGAPTPLPTFTPTVQPTSVPIPAIISIDVTPRRNSLRLDILLSIDGGAYCAAYQTGSPLSVTDIVVQNNYAKSENQVATVYIGGLVPITTYDVYCHSVSRSGTGGSLSSALATMTRISTLCCKVLTVKLSSNSIAADTSVTNMVSVSLSATPASSLTVVPTITSNDILPNALYPANAIFTAASGNSRSFTLLGLSEGQYQVGVALSGASAAEYDVVYASGAEFTVRAANAKSPAPVAQRAQFSSDAASVLVSFNAPTNAMLKSAPFQCSELFSFAFASECTCRFGDASSVTILLANKATLVVGNNVTMLGGKIRAKCAASAAVCATWDAAPEQVLTVQAPASPVTPVVSISCPVSASKCSSPVLDIGGSSGSGGRQWTSLTFGVAGSHADSVAQLQNFFTSTYKLNPPTSIPSGMLENGFYDITVSLCNFLQQCGSASHRLTIIDTTAPTVNIVGNKYRSMLSSQVLALSSNAYVASCAEQQQSNAVLSYAWKVSVDGLIVTLPQESRDTSKYRLASYTLTALKTYTIELTVTNTVSSLSSTTETMVYVTRGSLVAVISRGQAQSVRLGDSLVLDASPSYDEDVKPSNFDSSQYTYHFSCVQTAPQFNSSCGLQLSPVFGSNNKISVTTQPWVAVNSVFAVTFTFSDSTRQSQTGVTITVTSPASPIVQMQTSFSTKVNPSSQIKLSSVVQLSYYSSAKWSIDDSSFDLKKLALTPVSSPVTPGNNVVNFVLMSNVLNVARQSYVFQLQCDGVASSVAVTLNSPPSRGTLSVSPLNGTELDTVFQLAAFEWVDDDLPLTFEFGYFSNTDLKQVVQARSELSYASSKLPAGREKANFELSVFSRVLDVYNGEATSMTNVVVQKLQLSSSDLKSKAQEQMSTVTNGGDAAKQILSVMSSVLNGRDCSAAPDCSAKNRQECSTVANTCGACLSGYVGEDGAANSMCDLASDDDAELTCASNNDCSALDECVDAQCVRKSKSCPLGCSGHGECLYTQGDSDAVLEDCKIGDSSCNAVCECVSGYEGAGCDVSATEMSDKQATRELLLSGLSGVANSDEVTEDNVISWVNSLSAMTIVSDELSASAASTAASVAKDILSSASTIGLTYDKLMGLLDSVSAATLATYANTARRRLQESEVDDTIDILTSYGTLTANEMVAGQSNVDAVYSLFSVSSQVSDYSNGSAVVTSADDGGASSCSVVTDEDSDSVRAVVITTKSKMRGGLYSSNPFRLQLVNGSVKEAVFLLQNYVDALYEDYDYNITHRTDCEKGDYSSYEHECPVGDESVVVKHTCNGTKATVRTTCPKVHKLPICKILNGSPSFTCNATKFTASETTCHCYQTERRRLSSGLEGTGLLEVAALSVYVADEFAETILTADDLDSLDDLQEAMTVIFLYGSMWSIGLISIGMIAMKRNRKVEDLKDVRATTVTDRLMKYIDTVMPVVFNAESGWKRLWREVVHHHRYIQMFTSTDNNRFNRVITGIHLLTVQTMLMFILAVLYDTEFPTDDGSCTAYLTEEKCLRDKSVFDQEASTCSWKYSEKKDDYHCVFADRQLTWKVVVIISVVVAMFTSPMNSIVDFIFIDILSAPAADEAKVEPTLTKIGRRVSTAVRRASQAIVQAVQPKKRASRLSVQTTRVLPDAAVAAHLAAKESAKSILQSSMDRQQSDSRKSHPLRRQLAVAGLAAKQRRDETATDINSVMARLQEDILIQRTQVRMGELLDDRGEFAVQKSLFSCFSGKNVASLIRGEIEDVKKESDEKRSKLDAASDVQIGLEMLHLFVVDLLGRRTLAARLFITKSEEDFRHKIVLSRMMKVLLWGFVIVLNLFFVYFSMLRGLQRGSEWQRNFAFACVLQFIVEIVLYETSECVVMNFLVPNVATNEIRSAFVSVRQIVQRICQGAYVSYDHVLDAPQYLYVSTQLAKAYPHLLESALIRSFHTYMPGDISTKWRSADTWRNFSRRLARSMTISGLCLGLLRYFAMLPVELQRLFVHSVQPLLFSGIVIFLLYLRSYPYVAVVFLLPVAYLGYIVYRERQRSKLVIQPVTEKGDVVQPFEEMKHDNVVMGVDYTSDHSIHRSNSNVSARLRTYSDMEWQALAEKYNLDEVDISSEEESDMSSVYEIRAARSCSFGDS